MEILDLLVLGLHCRPVIGTQFFHLPFVRLAARLFGLKRRDELVSHSEQLVGLFEVLFDLLALLVQHNVPRLLCLPKKRAG